MKIIAVTDKGYILETTADDLAKLMGYTNDWTRTNTQRIDGIGYIGDVIPVHAMFDRLYRMANKEKELMEISAKLKAAADFVDSALPTVKHVNDTLPKKVEEE